VYETLFVGREDLYGVEKSEKGRRIVETVYEPLTDSVVRQHISGQITAHTYIQRTNSNVSYLVVDLDISKKILLQKAYGSPEFDAYLEKAYRTAVGLKRYLAR